MEANNYLNKNTILQINNLYKSYGKNNVLKGINLKLQKGCCLGIIGANGSGKTTLVEIICQVIKADRGKLNFNFLDKEINKNLGIQFQETGSWPRGLSINDILSLYKVIYPYRSKEELQFLIDIFSLSLLLKRKLNELSGGEKQRFNALLALFHDPKLIIFDEITTGLDLATRYKILFFLKTLKRKKKTIIIVSHIADEIEYLCDQVVLLHKGKIYLNESINVIKKKYNGVQKLLELYFQGKLKK